MSDRISLFWRYAGASLPTLQVLTARSRGMPFLSAPDPTLAADRLASSARDRPARLGYATSQRHEMVKFVDHVPDVAPHRSVSHCPQSHRLTAPRNRLLPPLRSSALLFGSWPGANVREYSDAHRPATDRRVGLTEAAVRCDRQRRHRCALMKAKQRIPGCEAGNRRFAAHGIGWIKFRCDSTPVRRKIIRSAGKPRNVGLSHRYRWRDCASY
jgi:hypothetical protein